MWGLMLAVNLSKQKDFIIILFIASNIAIAILNIVIPHCRFPSYLAGLVFLIDQVYQ